MSFEGLLGLSRNQKIMFTTTPHKLFCKPETNGLLVTKSIPETNGCIKIRSLIIEHDIATIYRWVNAPYAQRFWQMNGPIDSLEKTYQSILNHPNAHSFCAFYNDQLFCQADIYMIGCDELQKELPGDINQCSIHIITAPPKEHPVKGLSLYFLNSFLQYYFSFPQAQRIYGEPDCRNEKVHLLIKRAGFSFIKQAKLHSKTANIFCMEKEVFLRKNFSNSNTPI